jgi:hypothetical protein
MLVLLLNQPGSGPPPRYSVLGPGGYPRPPYGAFAGKPAGHPRVTTLSPGGYPKALYASFTGKPVRITMLGPGGYPRPPYAWRTK